MNATVSHAGRAASGTDHPPGVEEATASAWLKPILDGAPAPLTRLWGEAGRCGYYRLEHTRRIVAVEAPGGLELPIGITVPAGVVERLGRSSWVVIGAGRLAYDGGALRCVRYRAARPVFSGSPACLASAGRALEGALARGARPEVPERVWQRVDALASAIEGWPGADLANAMAGTIGLGPGSTPAGDDVICGAAATLAALGRGHDPVAGWSRGVARALSGALSERLCATTPLSAELLSCGASGYMLPRLANCIERALAGEDVLDAVDALRQVGHDSGYFLATGAAVALCAAANRTTEDHPDAGPY